MSTATLVYDDDCGFCTWWAVFLAKNADLTTVGFSELSAETLARLPDDYEECAHLVTDDEVYSCGASVEAALARSDLELPLSGAVAFARNFEDYDRTRERVYRWVADNRELMGKVVSTTPPASRNAGN